MDAFLASAPRRCGTHPPGRKSSGATAHRSAGRRKVLHGRLILGELPRENRLYLDYDFTSPRGGFVG